MVGIAVYMRTGPALTKRGRSGLAAFIGLLTLAWVATPFAPQPRGDVTPVRNLILLVVFGGLITLASWIDRQRRSEASQSLIGDGD